MSCTACGEHHADKGFMRTVLEAVLEVRKPSLFGELIIAITFLPIMTLQGMEGKMFAPLAFTVAIALLASLLLSIVAVPALCSFILKPGPERPSPLLRAGLWLYRPPWPGPWEPMDRDHCGSRSPGLLLGMTPFLGTEFIPRDWMKVI